MLWNPMLMKKAATTANLITSISLFATEQASNTAITVPAGVQAGDFMLLVDEARGAVGPATAVVPSGFTSQHQGTVNVYRRILSWRISDGTEAGTSLVGMAPYTAHEPNKLLAVFRADTPATSVVFSTVNFQGDIVAPANQNVAASGGSAPLIVCAAYSGQVAAVDPRGFTPAKDGEVSTTLGNYAYLAYKIYNSAPSNVTISMEDEATYNLMSSFYVELKALA